MNPSSVPGGIELYALLASYTGRRRPFALPHRGVDHLDQSIVGLIDNNHVAESDNIIVSE
jgi:hypothetical protein